MKLSTLLLLVIFFLFPPAALALPAFPGAQGFGSTTPGGSGRHLSPPKTKLYVVETLADSGPGSLRECTEGDEPRVCIFGISGRIELKDRITIKSPYITIAGETAPSPGVFLSGAGIRIAATDVVIRHLAIRVGDSEKGPKPQSRDALTIDGKKQSAHNIVLDHVSLAWALDENASTYGGNVRDVTFSHVIFAEGLYHSIHPDGPHSMGLLIGEGSQNITVQSSLFVSNNDRNPRQKAGSSLEFLNNVVHNWGGMSGAHGANPSDTGKTNDVTLLNFGGNYYIPGPDSPERPPLYAKPVSERFSVFVLRNFGPGRINDEADEWDISAAIPKSYRSIKPAFPLSGVTINSPAKSLQTVLATAGSRPAARDSVDSRIVEEVKKKSGKIRDCVSGCTNSAGGWPDYAVNRHSPALPDRAGDINPKSGYTRLEEWMFCLAKNLETGSGQSSDCIAAGARE